VPTLSDELADICATCLARDPQRRYGNAGQLRDALGDYLAGLGFARVSEELASFFADPPSYQKLMRPRIIASRLERGERLLAEKRTPRALACLNQVLALDATNARALALLKGLERERRLKQWRARGVKLGAGLLVASVLGVGVHQWRRTRTPEAPEARPSNQPPTLVAPAPKPEVKRTPPRTPPVEQQVASPKRPPAPRVESIIRAAPVPISILVRPYGYVRVDEGKASPQPLAQHSLELPPGQHTVTISCDYCEDARETIDVRPGAENVFRLRAQLKASRLSFQYEPADAQVRVGGEVRTVRETQERPFEIQSPRGPASFQHRVEYEVSHNGFLTEKRVALIEPGKPTTLRGVLVAE
jgi:serine/threonine-protein kinase